MSLQSAEQAPRFATPGFSASDWARFSEKLITVPEAGCWIWMGAIKSNGYGDIWLNGKVTGAHRMSHLMFKGPIPEGFDVCHKCDVRCCVNPDHLFVGTRFDNMADCSVKGRIAKPSSKLTYDQVIAIRSSDLRVFELAELYGVSQNIISRVRKRKHYGHVQ